jgi:hypothetical protein
MAFAVSRARVVSTPCSRVFSNPPRNGGSNAASSFRAAAAGSSRSSTSSSPPEISSSDATKYDALLEELSLTPPDLFNATVEDMRGEFTVSFYEHASVRVLELETNGELAASQKLDSLCGRVMAAADTAFGEMIQTLGDGSELKDLATNGGDYAGSTGLTTVETKELAKRWDAVSAKLAAQGELDAVLQATKNAESRRTSVVAILGRAPMGEKELRTLNSVTPERRIIDVLLSIPSGTEREDALSDALTPPERSNDCETEKEESDASETEKKKNSQMTLDGDAGTLSGDEEIVFTTPPRLLAAVELAVKEFVQAGDDEGVIQNLRDLRISVAGRCDFL